MKKLYQTIIFTVTLLCLPLVASAQTMEDKIRSLEATVKQLQETLLKMRAEIAKAKEVSASAEGGVVRSDGENITLSTTGGGLKLKSDNGNSFQFGGRLVLDYDNYDFDGTIRDAQGQERRWNIDASESEWRRTRITARGTVKKDWAYGLTINIDDADEAADINTAFIKYSGLPIDFTIGKFKEPFGLERLTSSKWISTIERSVMLDFLEGHGQPETGGVMVSGYHAEMGNFNWALGVFDDGQEDTDGDDNYAFTGRVAAAPRLSEDSFLHLGLAFSERERDDSNYRLRTRLGVHTADDVRDEISELRALDADDASQWGLEAAFVTGPFSLQAEYMDLEVDNGGVSQQTVDNCCTAILDNNNDPIIDDLEVDGYYIQATWTLTGEQRSYKTKGAYFDKVKPEEAMGAWELVARYEEADIEHGPHDYDGEVLTLGVNWYANSNVKFMLNYVDSELEGTNAANDAVDADGDAISLRAQYAF